jgi:hypothetical protein
MTGILLHRLLVQRLWRPGPQAGATVLPDWLGRDPVGHICLGQALGARNSGRR